MVYLIPSNAYKELQKYFKGSCRPFEAFKGNICIIRMPLKGLHNPLASFGPSGGGIHTVSYGESVFARKILKTITEL